MKELVSLTLDGATSTARLSLKEKVNIKIY